MGIFSRKQKVRLDEFCRDFFDRNIFEPILDFGRSYEKTVIDLVSEVDSTFVAVDCDKFHIEMVLIRLEVFGLAWLHQFHDEHSAAQSAYTKTYLEEKGRADIWDALLPYNQAISYSAKLDYTTETKGGRFYLTALNKARFDFFQKWNCKGFDDDAVGRAANRIAPREAWDKGRTAGYIMYTLCDHLDCKLNKDGEFRLMATIRGLYDGACEAMKQVKIIE